MSKTVAITKGKKHAIKITVIVMKSLTILRLAWMSSREEHDKFSAQICFVKYNPLMMLK